MKDTEMQINIHDEDEEFKKKFDQDDFKQFVNNYIGDQDLDSGQRLDEVDEWDTIVNQFFFDPDRQHQKDFVMSVAYQHLSFQEIEKIKEVKKTYETSESDLTDEDRQDQANSWTLEHYIDEKFGDRTEISNDEALKILDHDSFDSWTDDMPQEQVQKTGKIMPEYDFFGDQDFPDEEIQDDDMVDL